MTLLILTSCSSFSRHRWTRWFTLVKGYVSLKIQKLRILISCSGLQHPWGGVNWTVTNSSKSSWGPYSLQKLSCQAIKFITKYSQLGFSCSSKMLMTISLMLLKNPVHILEVFNFSCQLILMSHQTKVTKSLQLGKKCFLLGWMTSFSETSNLLKIISKTSLLFN